MADTDTTSARRRSFEFRFRRRGDTRTGADVAGRGPAMPHLGPELHPVSAGSDLRELADARSALAQTEQRYAALFREALEGILETTADYCILDANPAVREMFGLSDHTDLGSLSLSDFVVDHRAMMRVAHGIEDEGQVRQIELELRRRDGSTFWGSVTAQAVRFSGGGTDRVRLRVVDVTARVHAELGRRASEARFRSVLHHAVDAIVVVGRGGHVQYATPSAQHLLGHLFESGTLGAEQWRRHVDPVDLAVVDEMTAVLATSVDGRYDFELRLRSSLGEPLHLVVCLLNLRSDPSIRGFVWHVRNITEHRRVEAELAYNSSHDSLTGLSNRAALEHRLRIAIERIARDGMPVAVLHIDLDRFTVVNDALGHSAGNHVLKSVARQLSATLRNVDCLARPGADEFVVVLRLGDRTGKGQWIDEMTRVSTVARRILQQMATPVDVGGERVDLTASIGIALATTPTTEPTALLRDAEAALRLAKAEGRARFAFFDPDMRRRADERHRLERELRNAIENDRLELSYQPIADLRTGLVLGFEALLRWTDSTGRVVLPDEYLQLAEESGLIVAINDWVLREATRTLAGLQHDPAISDAPYVSFNTTARQVSSTAFVGQVEQALRASGADPAGLIVEITEHGLIGDIEACCSTLHGLHDLGVLIALDDFGTGFSSLSYLHHLPFDIVKIDRAFVAALDTDAPQRSQLAHAIIAMARSLDLETIAEGVETSSQMAALLDAGCVAGQGWGIAHPCTIDEARKLLN